MVLETSNSAILGVVPNGYRNKNDLENLIVKVKIN